VRPNRPAFTLFELILVLALLVVVGAISYPSINSMGGYFRVTSAADQLRGAWAQARARAMNDGIPYRFGVVPGKGNYRVAPDVGEFWSGNGNGHADGGSGSPPLVMEEALPKGVRFSTSSNVTLRDARGDEDTVLAEGATDNSAWTTVAVFMPDGTARTDAEVTLLTSGAKPLLLRMRGLTGVVTNKSL
jgi:prepilin-type N-terminal cleavage/methylation domain-containing protein